MNHHTIRIFFNSLAAAMIALSVGACSNDTPVLDKGELEVNPTELNFGTSKTTLVLNIKNVGAQNLSWTITNDANWIRLSADTDQLKGGDESQVTVSITRSALSDANNGLNEANLIVSAVKGAGSQVTGGAKTIPVKALKAVAPTAQMTRADIASSVRQLSQARATGRIAEGGNSRIRTYGHLWGRSRDITLESSLMGSNDKGRRKNFRGAFETIFSYDELQALQPGTQYYIRAYAKNDAEEVAYSQAWSFTIPDKSALFRSSYILVETPKNGWQQATQQKAITIAWQKGQVQPPFKIDLYQGNSPIKTLAASVSQANSYTYTPPADLPQGSGYYLKVTSLTSTSVSGRSGTFSIYNPADFPTPPNNPNTPSPQPQSTGALTCQWTQVTRTAGWSARREHSAVVFDNEIWVLGGEPNNANISDDIWYSENGRRWAEVTSNNQWSARNSFASVEYKGKVWVLGGFGEQRQTRAFLNDVWHSAAGRAWTRATASAKWSGRSDFAAIVFNNKIWIMGGNRVRDDIFYNDVWNSEDGINWTRVKADNNVGWSKRQTRGTIVVFKNKIWVIGGITGNSIDNIPNDVWSSTDGSTWDLVTNNAPWPKRVYHNIVVYNNKIWVIGGFGIDQNNESINFKDAWYSEDGVNWTQATVNAWWSGKRSAYPVVVFKNKIWALGGDGRDNANSPSFLNDVWSFECQ